jgi:hypothetical protein
MLKVLRFLILIFLTSFILSSCEKEGNDEIKFDENIFGKWEVVEFMSVESMLYSKNDNYYPIIEFKNDGSFSLELDQNNCSGNFVLSGENEIEITGPGCTKMCCDSDFSNKVATMLPQVTTYSFDEETLKLNVPGWGWISLKLK